jgi:teichuronic acid exporter
MLIIKKYVDDIKILLFGSLLAQVINLLMLPIITRIYTPTAYGQYSYIMQIVSLIIIFSTLRYETIIVMTRSNEAARILVNSIPILAIISNIFMCIVLTLLINYEVTSENLFNKDGGKIGNYFIMFVIAISFVSANAIYGYIQRNENYENAALSDIAQKAIFGICAIIFGLNYDRTYFYLLLSILISYLFKIIILNRAINFKFSDLINKKIKNIIYEYSLLFKPALSTATSHSFLIVTSVAPMYYINRKYGTDILGQYNLMAATAFLPSMLVSASIAAVYFQRANKIWLNGESILKLWASTVIPLAIISVVPFLFLNFYGIEIYGLIFGNEWTKSGEIAQLFAIPAYLSVVSACVDRTCLVVQKVRYGPAWHFFRMVSTVFFCIITGVYDLKFEQFVIGLSLVFSIQYIIDIYAQFKFAKINTKKNEIE